jgi:glycosyltransferase involved in cell wall biosynthesis
MLQSHPLISIIMTTYNRAEFIGETIESIQQQTYHNWELIIIDDGSDDNTEELVLGFTDNRIQFFKMGRINLNGKLKNFGIDKSNGELISFMDSDDLWHPGKLEKQIQTLQQYPDSGFSLTNGYNFKEPFKADEFFYKEMQGVKYGNLFLSYCKGDVSGFLQVLIFKKECLALTGLFDETEVNTDIGFLGNLAFHFKGVLLYEPLFYRRIHYSNQSHVSQDSFMAYYFKIMQYYKNQRMLPAQIANRQLFKAYISFGEHCIDDRLRRKAIKIFIIAWRYKPFSIIPLKKIVKALIS